ncbi:MAG: G8 domain-containing protein [Opitutales bacterium]
MSCPWLPLGLPSARSRTHSRLVLATSTLLFRLITLLLLPATLLKAEMGHMEHGAHMEHAAPMDQMDHSHHDTGMHDNAHASILLQVSHDKATVTSAGSGNWFEDSTWHGGVPGDGARVVIGSEHTVTLNGVSDAKLITLRVDGHLVFATDQNTQLIVDTMVVGEHGSLTVGTNANPVPANLTAKIILEAYNGLGFETEDHMSDDFDPFQVGLGLISFGRVEMHGANKLHGGTLNVEPSVDDLTIKLDEKGKGWRVGDTIAIAGTNRDGLQDEVREITAIKGRKREIHFEGELLYNHHTPTYDKARISKRELELKVHAINLTRNVSIETPEAYRSPFPDVFIKMDDRHPFKRYERRAHVMFMHTNDVDIRYVGFYGLGRTNKIVRNDGTAVNEDGTYYIGLNPIGRYSMHFHQAGWGPESVDTPPARIEGCALIDSPGWGYVNHSSHVGFYRNVAHGARAAAFVTEAGDELGEFIENISIRNDIDEEHGSGDLRFQNRKKRDEFAFGGHGFWFQGINITAIDNVASGCGREGMTLYPLPLPGKLRGAFPMARVDTENRNYAKFGDALGAGSVPVREFRGNIVYGSNIALMLGEHRPVDYSHVDKFLGWSVRMGLSSNYSAAIKYRDITLIGDVAFPEGLASFAHHGTGDVQFLNPHIEGFSLGIQIPRSGFSGANRTTDDEESEAGDGEFDSGNFATAFQYSLIENGFFNNYINLHYALARGKLPLLVDIIKPEFGDLTRDVETLPQGTEAEIEYYNTIKKAQARGLAALAEIHQENDFDIDASEKDSNGFGELMDLVRKEDTYDDPNPRPITRPYNYLFHDVSNPHARTGTKIHLRDNSLAYRFFVTEADGRRYQLFIEDVQRREHIPYKKIWKDEYKGNPEYEIDGKPDYSTYFPEEYVEKNDDKREKMISKRDREYHAKAPEGILDWTPEELFASLTPEEQATYQDDYDAEDKTPFVEKVYKNLYNLKKGAYFGSDRVLVHKGRGIPQEFYYISNEEINTVFQMNAHKKTLRTLFVPGDPENYPTGAASIAGFMLPKDYESIDRYEDGVNDWDYESSYNVVAMRVEDLDHYVTYLDEPNKPQADFSFDIQGNPLKYRLDHPAARQRLPIDLEYQQMPDGGKTLFLPGKLYEHSPENPLWFRQPFPLHYKTFAVSAFFRPMKTDSGVLIEWADSGDSGYQIALEDNEIVATLRTSASRVTEVRGGVEPDESVVTANDEPLVPGEWYHVLMSYNFGHGMLYLYVNGKLTALQEVPICEHSEAEGFDVTLGMGDEAFPRTDAYRGFIDDLQILERSFTNFAARNFYEERLLSEGGIARFIDGPNSDIDGDGLIDLLDPFPVDGDETVDADQDGFGDNKSDPKPGKSHKPDSDGDGIRDEFDAFDNNIAEWSDTDGDLIGDNDDRDIDGDGFDNEKDHLPYDRWEFADTDGDGVGDRSDAFPENPYEWSDVDGDGVGDNEDALMYSAADSIDSDGDGWGDLVDLYPLSPYFNDETNILNNGDAEDGMNGWETRNNGADNPISSIRPNSGNASFYMVNDESNSPSLIGRDFDPPENPIEGGYYPESIKVVNISGKVRVEKIITNKLDKVQILVKYKQGIEGRTKTFSKTVQYREPVWTDFNFDVTNLSSVRGIEEIKFVNQQNGMNVFLDDIQVLVIESSEDLDGDTIPDYLDPDDDGDGYADGEDEDPRNFHIRGDLDGDGVDDSVDDDVDGDGILDAIEVALGLNPRFQPDGLLDHDGDGQTTAAEILAGTNPTNRGERFELFQDVIGDTVRFFWNGNEAKAYDIEYSEDLIEWLPAPNGQGLNVLDGYTKPMSSEDELLFYRVRIDE